MSDGDERLTAALLADAPPERDPLFRIEVLTRMERARFRRQLLLSVLGIRDRSAVSGFSQAFPGVRIIAGVFGRWFSG